MLKRAVTIGVLCAGALVALAPHRAHAGEGDDKPGAAGDCVKVTSEARYVAYAYNHVVELKNECDKAMRCTVTTDANPTPSTAELGVGDSKSLLTFRGSPSSEFKATVDCVAQ